MLISKKRYNALLKESFASGAKASAEAHAASYARGLAVGQEMATAADVAKRLSEERVLFIRQLRARVLESQNADLMRLLAEYDAKPGSGAIAHPQGGHPAFAGSPYGMLATLGMPGLGI